MHDFGAASLSALRTLTCASHLKNVTLLAGLAGPGAILVDINERDLICPGCSLKVVPTHLHRHGDLFPNIYVCIYIYTLPHLHVVMKFYIDNSFDHMYGELSQKIESTSCM